MGRTLLERTQSILVLVTVVNGGKKIAIGYGAMRKLPPKFLFASDNSFVIGPYYVDADYRGRGYGKNIINVLSDIAAEFYAEHMVKNLGGYLCLCRYS